MLRVAITGGLGSGKSTVARMFAERGAHVISSDEVARQLMEPGESIYVSIVERFGKNVLLPHGTLDRKVLAQMAFSEGRVKELEAIVHPAVLAWQSAWVKDLDTKYPSGVAMVESALVFETDYTVLNEKRFDRILLVMATKANKRARFVQRAMASGAEESSRMALEADAERRLALQISDEKKIEKSDFVIENNGNIEQLERKINEIWPVLQTEAAAVASK
ncbi:MAG: dephospho-CoA kinase [Acidobacteria bacterium]|nr:dephospho-CoA kinase [Acidobacteriota bacterium]